MPVDFKMLREKSQKASKGKKTVELREATVPAINECYFQGNVISPEYDETKSYWRARMVVGQGKNVLYINLKAFDVVARALRDLNDGEAIFVIARYNRYRTKDGKIYDSFIVEDVKEPDLEENEETEEDEE